MGHQALAGMKNSILFLVRLVALIIAFSLGLALGVEAYRYCIGPRSANRTGTVIATIQISRREAAPSRR